MSIVRTVAPLALLLAAGCTSYSVTRAEAPLVDPVGQPPPHLGQICVLRPHAVGALVPVVVRDNGVLVGGTRANTYFCYFAEAGHHAIVVLGGDDIDRQLGTLHVDRTTLTVAAGGRYWLHEDPRNMVGVGPLTWVDEPTARRMVAGLDYAVLSGVPASQTLPTQIPVAPAR
jgi:hypothetical protein